MADRAELLEAALDVYPEGVALLDQAGRVVYWNRAAELLSGHASVGMVGRELPQGLEPLICCGVFEHSDPSQGPPASRGTLVHAQHLRGHDIPAIARKVILRDPLGARIGVAAVFHPADRTTALPHGETGEGWEVRESQAEMRDRLEAEFDSFVRENMPFSLMWIGVDQADEMRKSHGARACEAMLENVERTLANALRPGEQIGRWGAREFLILSHEREGNLLGNHARVLAGIARTADFRWWGDRLSLSVSIGAAAAEDGEDLRELLERAQVAMLDSERGGGNRVTLSGRRQACSPS